MNVTGHTYDTAPLKLMQNKAACIDDAFTQVVAGSLIPVELRRCMSCVRCLVRTARCFTTSHLTADAGLSYISRAKRLMQHHVTPLRRKVYYSHYIIIIIIIVIIISIICIDIIIIIISSSSSIIIIVIIILSIIIVSSSSSVLLVGCTSLSKPANMRHWPCPQGPAQLVRQVVPPNSPLA